MKPERITGKPEVDPEHCQGIAAGPWCPWSFMGPEVLHGKGEHRPLPKLQLPLSPCESMTRPSGSNCGTDLANKPNGPTETVLKHEPGL